MTRRLDAPDMPVANEMARASEPGKMQSAVLPFPPRPNRSQAPPWREWSPAARQPASTQSTPRARSRASVVSIGGAVRQTHISMTRAVSSIWVHHERSTACRAPSWERNVARLAPRRIRGCLGARMLPSGERRRAAGSCSVLDLRRVMWTAHRSARTASTKIGGFTIEASSTPSLGGSRFCARPHLRATVQAKE